MKLQYCTYDQSKKLKKLGFDWYTEASFVGTEFASYMGWKNSWRLDDPRHNFPTDKETGGLAKDVKPMMSCPSITIALKWLRETHKVFISVNATCSQLNHNYIGYNNWVWAWNTGFEDSSPELTISDSRPKNMPLGEFSHTSYEECESDALDIALTHLLNRN